MASDAIIKVINRVTGRVRMWRMLNILVHVGLWCVLPALVLVVIHKFVTLPHVVLWLPLAIFAVIFLAWTAWALSAVSRYEVAKQIDDEMGLKDRLTSALYFERSGAHGGLTDTAVADARRAAAQLETAKVQAGGWHRFTLPFVALLIVTVVVGLGPGSFTGMFRRSQETEETQEAKEEEQSQDNTVAELPEPETGMQRIERRDTMTGMTKLEQQEPPQRDPSTMDTRMDPDLLTEIQNIKAALDLKDLEEMRKDFEDENKKDGPAAPEEEKPVKMAPLDKELLDDLAAGEKKKLEKGQEGSDDAIGVAVRMPSKPGAKQKGPRTKAGGGHGGGDVGESGDTRGAPRRVPIAGRDKLIIESRRSKDVIEKTELERVVMNEVMMVLSMKDVTMTGDVGDVGGAQLKGGVREPVVEESVPLGLRGYVQRYFNGIGPRGGPKPTEAAPEGP
jgi:hypothetical protein